MSLNKNQSIVVACMILTFCIIYFGMDTKPKEQRALEMSRAANIEATGIQNIVMESKKKLSKDALNVVEAMQTEYQNAESDEEKIDKAKNLASKWYEIGFPIVSGYYAEQIAKLENTKDAWSISGTTYSIGMKNSKEEKQLQFARGRAIKSFETAITLEEENIADQINLALVYVDFPTENPMQGIQMLLKLNENYPENVQVIKSARQIGYKNQSIRQSYSASAKSNFTRAGK